ncbi:hypothetical protein [Coxiella burnetii]|uniref:Uncharacterized protein n=2 Tax=Coxiella burnetii TaxID=777 RepID=Q83B29_COXBU|nr:hypothetical protein [Coxiella burnetii]NP_820671.1 hypothetical protein CBU_1690 [Coxiella burnetii RSA 493]AAO91185.1 hypothetical protein CBU_1690 [Coxiella burnetii RSA 493]ACI23085.1 hypothetical protein CBUD_0311a [Coxiella burnetii Dugway 5J108-111]ACJ17767.1 hypothetical protein CbuG_0332 [Coxiella burnetii CbuG_Q212]ACJ19628.1 hypothetical protein CbuK_0321 [Coxiella burnetii CbuK_Q154]AIT62650.1 hypothetical protein CBNA_0291 [Coxiella burnetii str. Namibia]
MISNTLGNNQAQLSQNKQIAIGKKNHLKTDGPV